jgi:hypothetical protein
MSSIRTRIARTTLAVLTVGMAVAALTADTSAASPVQQPTHLANCGNNGIATPCFEKIWSNGDQVKMTYLDLNPAPSADPTRNFYVVAPQNQNNPQGWVPFLHDHVIGDFTAQAVVRYHAYFVLCSADGISSGGCVPSMTSIPGLGTIPFARTVNGQRLTSTSTIESPANAGLLTILDTGGSIIAIVTSD